MQRLQVRSSPERGLRAQPACEAAGSEPAATVPSRLAMQIPCRGERVVPTSVEPTSEEPTSVEPASAMPTSVEPTSVEPASAMPTSAMACGVAALPHQHGNVSQAMRGWEARLTAGIRARCTHWMSGR